MPNITPQLLALTVALVSTLPARAEPLAPWPAAVVAQEEPTKTEGLQNTHDDLVEFQQRFSAWKLRIATDATWPEAWSELADLRTDVETAALASPKNENLRSMLSDLQARAILWAAKLGDVEAASEWIVALSLRANERSTFPDRTLSLTAAMTMAREDVREVAANLPEGAQRAALPKPGGQTDDVVIARAVREAVARGDSDFLEKLGSRAVPALSDLALMMDGSPVQWALTDPLRVLLRVDIAAGLDVALELLRRDEYLLRKAVQDRIMTSGMRNADEVWVPVGDASWRLAKPEWAEILRRLVQGVDSKSEGLSKIVQVYAEYGVIPRDLGPACIEVLEAVSASTRPPRVFPESGRWFYVDCLDSPSERVRETAFKAIFQSPDAQELLRLARDPSASLRSAVASAMDRRQVWRWVDATRQTTEEEWDWMDVDEQYVEALQLLLTDPDPRVRGTTFGSAARRSDRLGTSVLDGPALRSLMPRFDADGLSRSLDFIRYLPESERLPTVVGYISTAAALDGEDQTKRQMIGTTLNVQNFGLSIARDLWPLAAAIERVAGLDDEMLAGIASTGLAAVRDSGASVTEYLDWLETHATEEIWRKVVGKALVGNSFSSPRDQWLNVATSAELARIVRLVANVDLVGPNRVGRVTLWSVQPMYFRVDAADLVALVRDTSAPLNARHWAANRLARTAPRELTMDLAPTLTEILAEAEFRFGPERFAGNPDAPELAGTVLRSLLSDPKVPDETLLQIDMSLGDPDLLELAIGRFPTETWSEHRGCELVENIVKALVKASVDDVDPRLAAANIPGSELQQILATWIGFTQSEALFPLLTEVMRTAPPYTDAWNEAIRAITGYLTDDAAAVLLETAKRTTNQEARVKVLAALDQIVAWQDAAARWELGRDAAARRAEAIDELTGMADDSSQPTAVRAEALRALGLLGAAEELPRLVRALTSDDEVIREAAREAIDRLHAGDKNDDDG